MTVLVLGVFSFLGYEIAQQYMKKGITVYGIQPMPLCKIHEEKWLRIGRNANFSFIPSLNECPKDISKVYICLYEPHEEHQPEISLLKEVIQKYPQSILISSVRAESKHSFFSCIEAEAQNCMIIRVPTLYGPWQPEEMSFHRIIIGENFFSVEEEEILFIRDAAVTLLEVEIELGCFTLTAKSKKYWSEAFYILTGKNKDKIPATNDNNKKLLVTYDTPIEIALEEQREHIKNTYTK